MTAKRPRADKPADKKVRELYAVGVCQAPRCGRCAIRWVPTAKVHPRTGHRVGSGAQIPLDHGRDPGGLIVLDLDPGSGEWSARPLDTDDEQDRPRYSVHWSSCHTPDLYREAKGRADPHGLFPPLAARRSTTDGPCASCGATHPHHYGPDASPLCPTCARKAVAGWSPAMAPTLASWTPQFRRLMVMEGFPGDG